MRNSELDFLQDTILGIYGTGGSGKELLEMLQECNEYSKNICKIVMIDDTKPIGNFRGKECYPFEEFSKRFNIDKTKIVIALGEPKYRAMLAEKVLEKGYSLASIIHPTASISPTANIEAGVVIRMGCVVSADSVVRQNTWLQNYVVVGHDAVIGENCQISNFVSISGNAVIGDNVYIGPSAVIREKRNIGNNVIVSMGAMVTNDVPDNKIAIGNPAHSMVQNEKYLVFK